MNVRKKKSLFTITSTNSKPLSPNTSRNQRTYHCETESVTSAGYTESSSCGKIPPAGKSQQNETRNATSTKDQESIYGGTKSIVSTTASSVKEQEWSLMGSNKSLIFEDHKVVEVLDMHGVRVRPASVTFQNTFENQSYVETISIQNISEHSVTLRIQNPRSWSFRVTSLNRGYLLAPGLMISRRIHYKCTKNGIVNSTLPIYVNEKVIDLPLEAYKGQAFVEIIPTSITFGRLDIGCKPVERKIVIKNVSFCATKFLVDIGSNKLDLQVSPMKGWIRPHNSVTIRVQLLALSEGIQSSELWITTDLCQTRIQVEVEACRRNFIVLHPNTISDFTLVDFPSTFYGCYRYQTLVVYNMSASSSAFVVLADFGIKGQQPFKEAQKGTEKNVKMFDIVPAQGKIRPFGKRIFTVWFIPTITDGEKGKNNGDVKDYLCAVQIKRIQFEDVGVASREAETSGMMTGTLMTYSGSYQSHEFETEMNRKSLDDLESQTVPMIDEISVLLYLYGEAEIPSLIVSPDSLYFPNTLAGNTVIKVVQLTNDSSHSLAFKYNKIPFFEVTPDFKKLAPKSAFDVTVKFCARNIGVLKKDLIFDILAQSNATDNIGFQVVEQVTVKIFGKVKSQKRIPEPRFNPGITPKITHEVGFLTDDVTFTSKIEKPRGAMTLIAQRGRPWYLPDATIAFPNDRPLTLGPRPTDATAKTIYKGLARYIPPIDESLTYTVEELIEKKAHDDWFLQYIRGTAALSIPKDRCCCKLKKPEPEPFPPVILQDKPPSFPREVFVPLTFVQLYRIKVYPAIINFGSVTTSKSCTQLLSIENNNDFKISARIIPLTLGINIQTLQNFIISKNSETKVMLTFQRETLGRYNGTVACIINGFHSFDIAVVAEVVHRSLTISPECVEIKIPEVPFANLFVPVAINNPLNIPVIFSWNVPAESPIKVEPITGVTPKRGTVWCVAFFEPENPNYKIYPINLMVEDTTCLKLKTGVVLPKTNVYFLESVVDVGYISMNLTTVKRFIIFNPDFSDAMFVVLNKEPTKGVKVKPASGTVRARGCYTITVLMTVKSSRPLDFTIFITLQNSATIELRVVGTVVYPEVEFTPQYINLHRVPCNSVSRTTIMAENKSKGKAEVSFEMDEYPQFKVSLSKRVHDLGLTSKGFTLEPGASQKFYLHFIPKDLASYDFYLPVVINNLCFRKSTKDMDTQGKMIKCMYRSSTSDQRKTCTSIKTKMIMSHLVLIDVVVLKPTLVFSETELFFSSTSELKSLTIKNVSEQIIDVAIRCEDKEAPFDYYIKGEKPVLDRSSFKKTIDPGDSVTYTATFIATLPGSYFCDLSIMITADEHSYNYTTVRLAGIIALPCVITSSLNEIYFQPVPLNIEASFVFHLKIMHNKQKETVIGHEISNAKTELFTVEYLHGNVISGITKTTIPVKITFHSSYPISLRNQITFKGGMNSQCTITLVATADNCLATTHAFLRTHTPHQPRLKELEELTEKLTPMRNERDSLPKQCILGLASEKKHGSSSGSSLSDLSLNTLCSANRACSIKKSAITTTFSKPSINSEEKDRRLLSTSDIELSYQLSEKEGRRPTIKESLVVTGPVSKEDEEIIFPMFPLESSESENSIHMNKTLKSVEQWVYEQVFSCSYNPIFGSHSFCSFPLANKKEYAHSSPVVLKNVFDVLERICGRRIRRFFTPIDKLPEDMTAKAVFTYKLYQQLVNFMVAQGALMAHVEPRYLMVYEEYCSYHQTIPPISSRRSQQEILSIDSHHSDDVSVSELLSPEKFHSISIQCWLDLFLQIFKTFVLTPAVSTPYVIHDGIRRTTHETDWNKSSSGRAEDTLLAWLTQQYNTQRTVVWPNKSPPPRTISNFDTDLEDGLVLTATTAAFCPYLIQIHFHDMFLNPTTISQAYHNTTCLCMAWDSIKLGFSVRPRDFVQPNTINMLLLVTHLYTILPSYNPEATITFKAILNASDSQIVTLENNEEGTITYHVEILPHNTNFSLELCENSFVLKRKSKGKIAVQYMARNTNKAEAILLLCGACMPPKFGRNYVFKLEGYPVKLPVSSSFNLISPQYIPVNTQITVESPHTLDFKADESYSYDLWIAYVEPQPENLNALRWAKEKRRKIPRRLFFPTNTLIVRSSKKKNGSGELPLKVCCFSQITSNFWLIFRNQKIGDFIVKLQITPRRPDPVMNLYVTISPDSKCSCTTDRQSNCSLSTSVNVPCRNLEQWAAVRIMFELAISNAEKEFWATYIESNIGFRLLKWMLEEKKEKLNEEQELLFMKRKTYKVSCPSKYISCFPTLLIPDLRSELLVPVQLHLDENILKLSTLKTVLNITSNDGHEVRSYNLIVVIDNKKL